MEKTRTVYGLRFELRYRFLKTTDLVWLFHKVRDETVGVLVEKHEIPYTQLRGIRLPFEIAETRTGKSLFVDLYPLLDHEGWVWEAVAALAIILLRELQRWWLTRRERTEGPIPPFGRGRPNLSRITTREISKEIGPDGEIVRETTIETVEESVVWRESVSRNR